MRFDPFQRRAPGRDAAAGASVLANGALVLMLALPGCVTKGTHEAALADAERAKVAHAAEATSLEQRTAKLESELEKARLDALERDAMLAKTSASRAEIEARLDEQVAMNQKLRGELEKLGKDVDALLAEGGLGKSIPEAKKRLAELRKAQQAAEARAELYAKLLSKFKKMIDSGELSISLRDGRMVLALPNDVLFDSGKSELKATGKSAIEAVASVLKTVPRKFQIAGHTDNQPIKHSPYASNWELSTARALVVVEFLLGKGIKPTSLSAAGYGEHDPVAPNESEVGRAKNRRIEITLQPDISEMVAVP